MPKRETRVDRRVCTHTHIQTKIPNIIDRHTYLWISTGCDRRLYSVLAYYVLWMITGTCDLLCSTRASRFLVHIV